MDEARVAEIRERAEAASVPDDEQLIGDGYLGYDVDGIPGGIRYAFERHEDYEFLLHARADVLALLAALAGREGEIATCRGNNCPMYESVRLDCIVAQRERDEARAALAAREGEVARLRERIAALEAWVANERRAIVPKVEADEDRYWDGRYDALQDVGVKLRALAAPPGDGPGRAGGGAA
jgi:hypothetical protein